MMRSNFRVSSAMAPISISSVSMISASRIATPAWHTAESLYEAVAQALGILREDQWVEEIGEGLTERPLSGCNGLESLLLEFRAHRCRSSAVAVVGLERSSVPSRVLRPAAEECFASSAVLPVRYVDASVFAL